jgi:hypothetical protein
MGRDCGSNVLDLGQRRVLGVSGVSSWCWWLLCCLAGCSCCCSSTNSFSCFLSFSWRGGRVDFRGNCRFDLGLQCRGGVTAVSSVVGGFVWLVVASLLCLTASLTSFGVVVWSAGVSVASTLEWRWLCCWCCRVGRRVAFGVGRRALFCIEEVADVDQGNVNWGDGTCISIGERDLPFVARKSTVACGDARRVFSVCHHQPIGALRTCFKAIVEWPIFSRGTFGESLGCWNCCSHLILVDVDVPQYIPHKNPSFKNSTKS